MRSYAWASFGGALLMTLVILGVFLIIMAATVRLINRQFHEIVGQEQEEQAFQIAEAGVSYAVWLMDSGLVDYQDPQPVVGYQVTDQTKDPVEVLGTFDLSLDVIYYAGPAGPSAVRVTSTGTDAVLVKRTQTIEAVVQSDDLDTFRVIEWDHKP